MTNNMPKPEEEKIIFVAKVVDNKVEVSVFSKYLPMLAHAEKMLSIEIDKLYIDERIKAQESPRILKATHNIIDFVRGKR